MLFNEKLVDTLYHGLELPNTISQMLALKVSACGAYFDIVSGDLKDVRISFDIDEEEKWPENLMALKPFEEEAQVITLDAIGNRIANIIVFKLYMDFEALGHKEHFVELPDFVVKYNMVTKQFTY